MATTADPKSASPRKFNVLGISPIRHEGLDKVTGRARFGADIGARGAGEAVIVPPIAAIANAIYHAVGVRMTELPMSPGAILKALESKNSQD